MFPRFPLNRVRRRVLSTFVLGDSPRPFPDFVTAEIVKWGAAAKNSGARMD